MPAHWNAIHWVGDVSGSATPAPDTPSLSINSAGTLATVTLSTSGSTNTLYVASARTAFGTYTWVSEGSRTSDGGIVITLTNGFYFAYVISETAGGAAISNLVYFRVGDSPNLLLHSPADVLRHALIALSYGTTPANPPALWPIYTGGEPDLPDQCITTFDTSSVDDGRMHISGERTEHYGVQVRVRASTHIAGYPKSKAISIALDEAIYDQIVTIDSTSYLLHSVKRTTDVIALGKETVPGSTSTTLTKRNIFVINCLLTLKPL